MVESGVHQLPIVRDGVLVGMLSRADVMRYMQLGAELRRTVRRCPQPRQFAHVAPRSIAR